MPGEDEASARTALSVETLQRWAGDVTPEQFLFRAAAHDADAQRGLSILWLASNDDWKKRVTERLTIPRLDTLDTTLQFDVDVGQIRRHGLRSDAQDTFWLPLLLSGAEVPSVLSVVDEADEHVPRLTTAEVRWALAAALADLLVRSNPSPVIEPHRRGVERLLGAVLRTHLDAELRRASFAPRDRNEPPGGGPAIKGAGLEGIQLHSEHDRRRTKQRLDAALGALKAATWTDQTALGLASSLAGVRMLVVACARSDLRESYRCTLPSRTLEVSPTERVRSPWQPRPERTTAIPALEVLTSSVGAEGRPRSLPRRDKLRRWMRHEGPATGRTGLRIDLLAVASAANYHVILELPARTETALARLEMRWDLHRLTGALREARDGLEAATTAVRSRRDRRNLLVLQREVFRVQSASTELSAFLKSLQARPADAEIHGPGSKARPLTDVSTPLDVHHRTTDALTRALDRHPTLTSRTEPAPVRDGSAPGPPTPQTDLDHALDQLQKPQATLDEALPAPTEEQWITAIYHPRREAHTDRVHIAVPATDRVDRRVEASGAQLLVGVRLADPRPHTATNIANFLNLLVLALIGLLVAGDQALDLAAGRQAPAIQVEAIVAVVLLFTGVQAARIERPGRTEVFGWLGRMPYMLGFLSPIPAVIVALVAAGGLLDVADGWARPAICLATFGVASALQAALWLYGVHASREASRWDGQRRLLVNEPGRRHLDPMTTFLPRAVQRVLDHVRFILGTWRIRRHPSSRRPYPPGQEREVPPPDQRLLGEVVRSLPGGSIWFTPLVVTVDHEDDDDHVPPKTQASAVSHLHSLPARTLLGEALVHVDTHRAWHLLKLVVPDGEGRLGTVLDAMAATEQKSIRRTAAGSEGADPRADDTTPSRAPRIDLASTLGASFGGYAVFQMLVSDPTGGDRARDLARRLEGTTDPAPLVDVSPGPIDLRGSPIRAFVDIYEIMMRVVPDRVGALLATIAERSAHHELYLVLVHVPSTPPADEGKDDESEALHGPDHPVWLRARIGVTAHNQDAFTTFLTDLADKVTDDERLRVTSVSEFARPAIGATSDPREQGTAMVVSDRTVATGPGGSYVLIDTVAQRGITHMLMTALKEHLDLSAIRGYSAYGTVGRGLNSIYLDRTPPADLEVKLQKRLRTADPNASVVVWDQPPRDLSTAGPDASAGTGTGTDQEAIGGKVEPERLAGPGVRLTWTCPNVPGVLGELISGLSEVTEHHITMSYLVARVAEVDSNRGRLVFRIKTKRDPTEDPAALDDPLALEAEVRQLTNALEVRVQQIVDRRLRDAEEGARLDRRVFISADLFVIDKQTGSTE